MNPRGMCSWCGGSNGCHHPECIKSAPYDQFEGAAELAESLSAQYEDEDLPHLSDSDFDARMVAERERAEPTSRALWEQFFHGCILKGCGRDWADELLVELEPQFHRLGLEDDDTDE